jgi:hypothetical protein
MLLMMLAMVCCADGFTQEKPQGIYMGLEKIYKTDSTVNISGPYTPKKYQWFYLSYIAFEGDSVFLEQMPVSVYKNDTIYSASDGEILSYSGMLRHEGTSLKANLALNECDTCPMRMIDFTPAKGAADNIEDINAEPDTRQTQENKTKNKVLNIEKMRRSKNLTINGNIFRPQ